jgi:penicillin-binding protein 1C
MDGEFLGETTGRHEMPVSGSRGDHVVTAIDDEGNEISLPFYIQTGD